MTQFLPPNLLALFAPRDPLPYLPPADKLPHEKKSQPYSGLSAFVGCFEVRWVQNGYEHWVHGIFAPALSFKVRRGYIFSAVNGCYTETYRGTHEDERTVLYRTESLDGTKPDTNPNAKTNPNPNTNPNPKTNSIQLFYVFSSTVPWSSV